MADVNTATVACPSCASTNGVPMSDGTRLCLDCRNEWNPADVPAARLAGLSAPAPAAGPAGDPDTETRDDMAPAHLVVVDDVLGPPAEIVAATQAQAALDALVGTDV